MLTALTSYLIAGINNPKVLILKPNLKNPVNPAQDFFLL